VFAGLVTTALAGTTAAHAQTPSTLPAAPPAAAAASTNTATPIKHFVFLMQENHSFDNYFGTYPGADGIPADVCMPVAPKSNSTECVKPSRVGNRPALDLSHNPTTHAAQYDGGKMDGFVSAFSTRAAGELAMAHYDDQDLPYYWNIADNYVLFDRFFSSAHGGSVRNHMYWVAGQPGSAETGKEAVPLAGWGDTIPTIFDRLEAAGISWKFYIQNYDPTATIRSQRVGDKGAQVVWAPLLAMDRFLDNPELSKKIVNLSEYFNDLHNNTLPSVAFIVPSGTSEHPPGSIQAGEAFVRTLINGLVQSSAWSSSAFLWSYDDWGGFYDHVAPPQVDSSGYGFRVPALLVSPYAKRGFVDHTTLDFTAGIAFIRDNWGVAPLASRDTQAASFMDAFDFKSGPRQAVLLSSSRVVPKVQATRSGLLYSAYGTAVVLPIAIVFVALKRKRPRLIPERGLA
jgi:phospholipase C